MPTKILFSLTGGPHVVHPDLAEDELRAIGKVTAAWAYLEHGIYAISAEIAEGAKIPVPADVTSNAFKRRLGAMRLLIDEYIADDHKQHLLKQVSRIANVQKERHQVTHGMWDWDYADPDTISNSSFRPGFEFEKPLNAKKIEDIAKKIGAISFALQYPNGWHDVLSDYTDENGHVSYAAIPRERLREKRAEAQRNQSDRPESTPPKRRRPPKP